LPARGERGKLPATRVASLSDTHPGGRAVYVNTTSVTLLERIRRPGESAAWDRFVSLYTPLLYYWARRAGLQEADAADLVQDVLARLVRSLPTFEYDPQKSFRTWLRAVLHNAYRDRRRRTAAGPARVDGVDLDALPGPAADDLLEADEYRRHLLARALRVMQAEFPEPTWRACWEFAVAGRPAADVAAELGIAVGAVYVAKSRVLSRVREELSGLLD
jgi:RNA polymerase sigma-70 factor (ECF subfamily)